MAVAPWLRHVGSPELLTLNEGLAAVGALYLVAIAGAIVCVLTRSRGDPPIPEDPGSSARGYAPYPLAFALSIIGRTALEYVGIASEAIAGVAFLAAGAGTIARDRLPELAPTTRRALMTPYLLVSATFFEGIVADIWPRPGAGPSELIATVGGLGILGLLILGTAVFYLGFVFAPRQIVEVTRHGWVWPVRFALFVLGLVLGIGIPAALG